MESNTATPASLGKVIGFSVTRTGLVVHVHGQLNLLNHLMEIWVPHFHGTVITSGHDHVGTIGQINYIEAPCFVKSLSVRLVVTVSDFGYLRSLYISAFVKAENLCSFGAYVKFAKSTFTLNMPDSTRCGIERHGQLLLQVYLTGKTEVGLRVPDAELHVSTTCEHLFGNSIAVDGVNKLSVTF